MVQSRTSSRLITHRLVKAFALAGAVGTAIVAPNTVKLLDKLLKDYDSKSASRTLATLKYRKIIDVRKVNGQLEYKLSGRGWDVFEKIQLTELAIDTPIRWDHKWRVVAFDLPASHNKYRRQLLYYLRKLEFYRLQDSLWVHPFPCDKQIGIVLNYLHIEHYVTLMTVEGGNFTPVAERHFIDAKKLM